MLVSEGEKYIKKKHYNAECKQQAVYRGNPFPGSGNVILTPEEAIMRKLERENRELREEIRDI